jgi:hypothetical protein
LPGEGRGFRAVKILTQSNYRAWCEERGLQIKDRWILDPPRSKSVVLRIPKEASRIIGFVCELLPREEQFPGGLFWVVDTGALSDDIMAIGQTILMLMRKSYGLGLIQDAPACLFANDERLNAQAFLALPLLFAWGGYFVPDHVQYFFDINPDGVLEVVTESKLWIDFFSAFPEKMGIREHGKWIARK